MASNWNGHTVVITGSSSGIGRETALRFAAGGARIVLHGRNEEKLKAVDERVREVAAGVARGSGASQGEGGDYGPAAGKGAADRTAPGTAAAGESEHPQIVTGDISEPSTSKKLAEAAEKLGGATVLINNAGMSMRGAFGDVSPKVFSEVCETNVVGSALATQALYEQLIAHRGSVVFVSSVAGMSGFPGVSIYAAAKMALSGLAESLRAELFGTGVHVGVIHLGFTENDPDKRILAADGSPASLTRKSDMSQADAAAAVERMVLRRKERVVLTAKGHLLSLVQRVSPRIATAIIRRTGGTIHKGQWS